MARAIRRKEPIGRGLRRLIRERVDAWREAARSGGRDAVHRLRRELKTLRALLRIAREGMAAKRYRALEARLRELSRPLGELRDAEALVASLGALRRETQGKIPARLFEAPQARLREELAALEGARGLALGEARERVDAWEQDFRSAAPRKLRWAGLSRALADTQRQARAASKAALAGDGAALHALRKRVKRLRPQLAVLRRAAPAAIDDRLATLKALSDALGADHDLALLAARIDALEPDEGSRLRLRTLLWTRRAELQAEASLLAQGALLERPGELGASLRRAWRRWR